MLLNLNRKSTSSDGSFTEPWGGGGVDGPRRKHTTTYRPRGAFCHEVSISLDGSRSRNPRLSVRSPPRPICSLRARRALVRSVKRLSSATVPLPLSMSERTASHCASGHRLGHRGIVKVCGLAVVGQFEWTRADDASRRQRLLQSGQRCPRLGRGRGWWRICPNRRGHVALPIRDYVVGVADTPVPIWWAGSI
jgi:hypothetical protein